MRVRFVLGVLLAAAVTAPACGVHGLSFVKDDRVDIVKPDDRAKVALPTTIDWTTKNFTGSYGVLVDQAPPPAGKSLSWLFRGSDSCRGTEGKRLCAQADFLAERNVFETADTRFTVQQVPKLTGNDRRREFHEVTVILLDHTGHRVGEGAWSVQFEVKKRS